MAVALKLLPFLIFLSIGFSASLVLNGFIEYKLFSLPKVFVEESKLEAQSKKEFDLSYIKYLFLEEEKKEEKEKEITPEKEKNTTIREVANIQFLGSLIVGKKKIALIKVGDERKFVKEKDTVNGYKVEKIEKYRIILSKNGKLYKVSLKLQSTSKNSYTKRTKTYTPKPTSNSTSDRFVIDKDEVERITRDVGKIFKNVLMVPVVKDGQTQGFKFKYVNPNSILYKYGIRSGDMIVSINDMPIKTPEEAFKVYNLLRNESIVRLKIMRNGQEREIIYEIR